MSFFFNDTRASKPKRNMAPAKARLEDIPVTLLRERSCSVCPRDKDTTLRHPKMEPHGARDAPVYLLGSSPSAADDKDGRHWSDDGMYAVAQMFGRDFMQSSVRSNYTAQCMGEEHVAVTECCRGRIEVDIERVRPLVIVTVGDAPLRWVTGLSGATAPQFRGSLFATRIGTHTCYVMPLLFPNYVYAKGRGKSKYELALEHDVRWLKKKWDQLPPAKAYSAPYDDGITYITGDQPSDIHLLEKELIRIARHPLQALDLETTGLRPFMQRNPAILTAAVGTFSDTLAFPLRISDAGHDEGWGTRAREQRAMELFAEYLQHSGRKACHNTAFEMEWLAHDFGQEILRRTEWDDTMAMAYVTDGRSGTKSLEVQTRMHFGFNLKAQSPIDVRQEQWWLKYSLRTILRYNGMDTKWTDLLRERYYAPAGPGGGMDAAAERIYEQRIRLAPALVQTELPGLEVDFDYARKMDAEMRATLLDVEHKLAKCKEVRDYERMHGRFEPTNSNQVLVLMHGMLGRAECEREDREGNVTKTTDEEALSAIPSHEVPSAPLVLQHREISKIHGTYVLPALQKKWVCRDGRIRSKYSSLIALTGRLASEDPNEQNWPKRKHREVRGMIRSRRHRWLVSFDYGQIEFRVVGMVSQDKNLVRYCWTEYDVHKHWAERLVKLYGPVKDWIVQEFGVDWDEKGIKTLRQEMKNKWVFPQFFGSTPHSCAVNLHLPDDVAYDMAEEFWDDFAGVKKWQEYLIEFYNRNLYVETLGGLKRRGLMSINELINHPIQGTAAEIVQEAHMVLSERADSEFDPELQPILNVHDDLTFDISDTNLEAKVQIIAREMCMPRFDYINVPLLVEVGVGERWDGIEEIAKYRSDVLFDTPNPYKGQA